MDALARSVEGLAPTDVLQEAARHVIAEARAVLGPGGAPPSLDSLRAALVDDLMAHGPLREVVNATGVLLHTNLGRAPVAGTGLAPEVAVDLELDRVTGARGRRFAGLERSLALLTGGEAALVVNNNAAAVLVAVSALAAGREVIVGRGELVEIGGSFRIPEVIVQGGAVLREVGATNCLHPRDLEDVMRADTGLVLEVHPSNYRLVGFTATVPTGERADIAHRHGVPLVVDAGAGLLDERCPWLAGGRPAWLTGEPGVRQLLGAGADIVAFSGDKLLGGPQAGVLVGSNALIDRIRGHPLARAVRFDKVRAAHLEATLLAYHEGTVASDIPFWNLATTPVDELERRAEQLGPRSPNWQRPTFVRPWQPLAPDAARRNRFPTSPWRSTGSTPRPSPSASAVAIRRCSLPSTMAQSACR